MIKYQRDYEKQYDESIKTILRSHNEQFSNIHDFSSLFVKEVLKHLVKNHGFL